MIFDETMQRMIKNSNLYDLAPDLVKEWHPTANGNLTPRTVRIAYSEKVYWICSESHEWKATIKRRIMGKGCPYCAKDRNVNSIHDDQKRSITKKHISKTMPTSKALFADFEMDTVVSRLGHNFRKNPRYKMKATAVIESPISGHWFYADVKNFSAGGMGFETDAFIDLGTKVIIKLDRPLLTSDRTEYDSIVRWCKIIDDETDALSNYGMGTKFL